MFDFELFNDEKIEIISNEALLKINDEIKNVSVIITNERFMIFSSFMNEEVNRLGRMIDTFKESKKKTILEIPVNNIDKIIVEKDFDKYFLKDTNYFYLYDEVVKDYLKDVLKIEVI